MAAVTGVVPFEAAGAAHTLQFTTNRLCLLEDKTKLSTIEVATELALGRDQHLGVSASTLRALVWAGLGDGGITLAQAGDIVDLVGAKRMVGIVIEAFDAAFPDDEEGEPKKAGEDANPPSGAAG
jgi:hypothetical protein